MANRTTVTVDRAIDTVEIIGQSLEGLSSDSEQESAWNKSNDTEQEVEEENGLFQAMHAVQSAADKVEHFYEQVLRQYNEKIAAFSLEIARKVLMQKVKDRDYEIEEIIKEVLNSAPTREKLVLRLNPHDFAECKKKEEGCGNELLSCVELVSDNQVGPAECVLDTPKGVVESIIEHNLERIREALERTS